MLGNRARLASTPFPDPTLLGVQRQAGFTLSPGSSSSAVDLKEGSWCSWCSGYLPHKYLHLCKWPRSGLAGYQAGRSENLIEETSWGAHWGESKLHAAQGAGLHCLGGPEGGPRHWQHRLKAKGLGPECCSRDLQCILPFTDSLQEETAGHSGDEESTDWGLHFLFTPEGSTANRRFCL